MGTRGADIGELEALYRESLPRFVRAASAIVGDESLGKDAVQDAFVRAVRERRSFRGEVPLEAWVWRIVTNSALDARARHRRDRESEGDALESFAANGHPEADAAVRAWVAALPERQRLAVFLRYFADLDYRGIAAALGIEVGTVSATLSAAHTALRRSFEEVQHS
jgi:RNA polymerase sigma-70 factor (ECF subfamily)